MQVDTAIPSFENPVFRTYVLAASIMILKLMLQPWISEACGHGSRRVAR
jgi:glutathione S-transferase